MERGDVVGRVETSFKVTPFERSTGLRTCTNLGNVKLTGAVEGTANVQRCSGDWRDGTILEPGATERRWLGPDPSDPPNGPWHIEIQSVDIKYPAKPQ
tara:strand:+ start:442 stop:735 length:294 start_codon:yes stop_codon:yes gene_type:complete